MVAGRTDNHRIAELEEDILELHQICDERQKVIEELDHAAKQRLALVEQLHQVAEERLAVIKALEKDVHLRGRGISEASETL